MRRVGISIVLLSLGASLAWAQVEVAPPQPARPAVPTKQRAGLQGEAKLRYVLKQLDLDAGQKDIAESLIVTYNAECQEQRQNGVQLLQEIRARMQEVKDARAAGDNAKAEELERGLQEMRPGVKPEKQFYEALEPNLTPEQRTTLAEVRKRLEEKPDPQLTPADVVKAARDQGLAEPQEKKLVELTEALRSRQASTPAADAAAQTKLLDEFVSQVRALLEPKQQEKFDKQIEKMRPDPLPAPAPTATPTPAPAATTQPAPTKP